MPAVRSRPGERSLGWASVREWSLTADVSRECPSKGLRLRQPVQTGRIRHTVSFRLRHPAESDAERDFLNAARKLGEIPGVEGFDILAEVSPKNQFRFGISMEFEDAVAYATYNQHPVHVRFVEERWVNDVEEFLEIDYAALPS